MEHNEIIKQLSEKLSVPEVYTELTEHLERLNRPNTCIGLLGQGNSGKTSMINILTEANIPVSLLPSQTNIKVEFGEKMIIPAALMDTEDLSISNELRQVTVNVPCQWLSAHKAIIYEKQTVIAPETASVNDIINFLSDFDVCIYMMDAQAALTRTDSILLEHLSNAGIPVLAVIGKIELLAEEDRADVDIFVRKNVSKYKTVTVFSNNDYRPLRECREELISALKNMLVNSNVNESRDIFANLYAAYAVAQLYENCEAKIAECNAKQSEVEKLFTKKLQQLNDASMSWLEVETMLKKRNSETNAKIRASFLEKKDEIVRRLTHDAELAADVKTFWEKDIPFRLEEYMKNAVQSVNQIANNEMITNVNWLQSELLRRFRCRLSITSTLIREGEKPRFVSTTDDLVLSDTGKLRIITRIGSAATVVTAGVMLATSGVAGIIMATSMLAGVGSEIFIHKKTNESREIVKQYLPTLVDKMQSKVLEDFSLRLTEAHSNIISQLNLLQVEWSSNERKSIEQEKSIASFNCSPTKWVECRDSINQVAALLIRH